MNTQESKQLERQLERQRREKRFHRRLTTLSWTLPVVAFGSFFSVWHDISQAVRPTTSGFGMVQSRDVLFKIGMSSSQVAIIQEQLQALGYFNHVITEYYGPVTAAAVAAFQSANRMSPTGVIDTYTLDALRTAVKNKQVTAATATFASSQEAPQTATQSTNPSQGGFSVSQSSSQGSTGAS